MKFKIIICLFLFLIIFCCIFKKNDMKLEGDLIIPTPNADFDLANKGIVKYNLKDKSSTVIYNTKKNFDIFEPNYNYDKSKIIFSSRSENYTINSLYDIFEYDVKTNSIIKIANFPSISAVKYVPNSNCISYIYENKLVLYNLETNMVKEVFDDMHDFDYSWSNDGESFLYTDYTNGRKIYKYNLINSTSEFLFDGCCPMYSNDNKYIAYFDAKSYDTVLVLKNMNTGEEKRHKQLATHYSKFSPKGDKIACIQEGLLYSFKLVIWDFETDQTYTLIDNVRRTIIGFDWK